MLWSESIVHIQTHSTKLPAEVPAIHLFVTKITKAIAASVIKHDERAARAWWVFRLVRSYRYLVSISCTDTEVFLCYVLWCPRLSPTGLIHSTFSIGELLTECGYITAKARRCRKRLQILWIVSY